MSLSPPTIDEVVDDLLRRDRPVPVLLADDDDEMRALLSAPLREGGYDLVEARSGVEVIRAIQRFETSGLPLQLIITDVRMPGFTGIEVLQYLRYAGLPVPVIVMTAFGDARLHSEARELSAAAVFDKPFDVDELLAEASRLVFARVS